MAGEVKSNSPWAFGNKCSLGYHEDRTPTHGYEATREEAMASRRVRGGSRFEF